MFASVANQPRRFDSQTHLSGIYKPTASFRDFFIRFQSRNPWTNPYQFEDLSPTCYKEVETIASWLLLEDPWMAHAQLTKLLDVTSLLTRFQDEVDTEGEEVFWWWVDTSAVPGTEVKQSKIWFLVSQYDQIYLLGTQLSACINSWERVTDLNKVVQLANIVDDIFSSVDGQDLANGLHDDLVKKLRQAIPMLFSNLATTYRNLWDYDNALKWYRIAYQASAKLWTIQFAFIAAVNCAYLSPDEETLQHADDLCNLADELIYSKYKWTTNDRTPKNRNKVENSALYMSWKVLYDKYRSELVDVTLQVEDVLIPERSRNFSDLTRYIDQVRQQKNRFLSHVHHNANTRDPWLKSNLFEDSDAGAIGASEVFIAVLAHRLLRIYGWERLPESILAYTNIEFWIPRAITDDELRRHLKTTQETAGVIEESKPISDIQSTVLNVYRHLDLRDEWMILCNKFLRTNNVANWTPRGDLVRMIIPMIMWPIAALDPRPGIAISQYFLNTTNPNAQEFATLLLKRFWIENISWYGMPLWGIQQWFDPRMTQLGCFWRDSLLKWTHADLQSYFDKDLWLGTWAILCDGRFIFWNEEIAKLPVRQLEMRTINSLHRSSRKNEFSAIFWDNFHSLPSPPISVVTYRRSFVSHPDRKFPPDLDSRAVIDWLMPITDSLINERMKCLGRYSDDSNHVVEQLRHIVAEVLGMEWVPDGARNRIAAAKALLIWLTPRP